MNKMCMISVIRTLVYFYFSTMYIHITLIFILNAISSAFTSCPVYLTVSSNSLSSPDANLVLNWNCDNPPSIIRIYGDNPYLSETPSLKEIKTNNLKYGKIETGIKIGQLKLENWDKNSPSTKLSGDQSGMSNCINYYALSFNQTNHVTNFECLKMNPQWMQRRDLWLFQLKHLLLPGTKCSGCFRTRTNSKRRNLRKEDFKQRFDVWQQLVMGIRYLDFSVGYFRSFHEHLDIRGRFWVFSEKHEISPIFPILEDVLQFAEISKEIVILDFSNFTYGFHEKSGAHEIFKKLLVNMFGHIAFINQNNGLQSFDLTIQQMRAASRYLLILYNHDDLNVITGEKQNYFLKIKL